jgi:hypothetical protein
LGKKILNLSSNKGTWTKNTKFYLAIRTVALINEDNKTSHSDCTVGHRTLRNRKVRHCIGRRQSEVKVKVKMSLRMEWRGDNSVSTALYGHEWIALCSGRFTTSGR